VYLRCAKEQGALKIQEPAANSCHTILTLPTPEACFFPPPPAAVDQHTHHRHRSAGKIHHKQQ